MRPPPSHDELDEPTRLLPPAVPSLHLPPSGALRALAPLPGSGSATAAMPTGASDIRALVAARPDRTLTVRSSGLPRFELRSVLGRGGVGEVWLAFDRQLDREVAIKFLQPTEAQEAPERLVREARIQAALDHPAIVPVYDVGLTEDGRVFVAMKRVRGVTMASLVATGASGGRRPGRTRLLRAFVRVCEAIEYAHASGILHSDLKPENVLIGEFGDVYVLDWGISRRAGGRPQSAHFGGTPIYMAPERFTSTRPPEVASDVYALGCILFEILTGESLAPEHLPLAALATHVRAGMDARPESRAAGKGCPRALSDACVAATTVDPAHRTRSVAELRAVVERLIDRVEEEAERRQRAESAANEAEKLLGRLVLDLPTIERAARLAGEARLLDPSSPHAAAVLDAVLAAHGRVEGPQLDSVLGPARRAATRAHAWSALPAYAAYSVVAGLAYAAGLVDGVATAFSALIIATGVYVSLVLGRKGEALERAHVVREWILARALGSSDRRGSRASDRPQG